MAGHLGGQQVHMAYLGRPGLGCPGLHRHCGQPLAVQGGSANSHQLGERHARQGFDVDLDDRADGRGWGRRSSEHEGAEQGGLIGPGEHPDAVQHGLVPYQRRVAVGQAGHNGGIAHGVLAKDDACHVEAVLGSLH